jgi:hypothetical protein
LIFRNSLIVKKCNVLSQKKAMNPYWKHRF